MNSSAAEHLNNMPPVALDGLDDFYEIEPVPGEAATASSTGTAQDVPGSSTRTSPGDQNFPGTADWLTVEQAAKRLSITRNAVIKRLNKGSLAGTKVPGQWGEEWRVPKSALPQEIHLHVTEEQAEIQDSQAVPSTGTNSLIQEQPQPNTPIASHPDQSLTIHKLLEQIEFERNYSKVLNEKLEAANHRNGYLEAQVDYQEVQLKLLTDSQHKKSWWQLFGAWLLTSKRDT